MISTFRGMAVCLSLMMGRLGGVVGANMVATLIDNHCSLTFLLASITLICKLPNLTIFDT